MIEASTAKALHDWYREHHGVRNLPWRRIGEARDRVFMVEGLLAQTRADAVAANYDRIFDGIETHDDWLRLVRAERHDRVAPLGLPKHKANAVTSIATALKENSVDGAFDVPQHSLDADELIKRPGIGPYIAAMVALLDGREAIPVDTNIDRVGKRYADDGDHYRWMAALVGVAINATVQFSDHPAGYEITCAVMDLGALICTPRTPLCWSCPLRGSCASPLSSQQLGFEFG